MNSSPITHLIAQSYPLTQSQISFFRYNLQHHSFCLLSPLSSDMNHLQKGLHLFEKFCWEKFPERLQDQDATLSFFYSSNFLLEENILVNSLVSLNQQLVDYNKTLGPQEGFFLSLAFGFLKESCFHFYHTGDTWIGVVKNNTFTIISWPKCLGGDFFSTTASYSLPLHPLGSQADFFPSFQEIFLEKGDILLMGTGSLLGPSFSQFFLKTTSLRSLFDKIFQGYQQNHGGPHKQANLLAFSF